MRSTFYVIEINRTGMYLRMRWSGTVPRPELVGDPLDTTWRSSTKWWPHTRARRRSRLVVEDWRCDMSLETDLEELNKLRGLEEGWDSYDAKPPNDRAIWGAEKVLEFAHAKGLPPGRVTPSVVNAVYVGWSGSHGWRAGIESDNDGDVYLLLYGNGVNVVKDVWSIGLDVAMFLIGRHINRGPNNPEETNVQSRRVDGADAADHRR